MSDHCTIEYVCRIPNMNTLLGGGSRKWPPTEEPLCRDDLAIPSIREFYYPVDRPTNESACSSIQRQLKEVPYQDEYCHGEHGVQHAIQTLVHRAPEKLVGHRG